MKIKDHIQISFIFFLCVWMLLICQSTMGGTTPIYDYQALQHPIIGSQGMVSTQESEASKIGIEILKQGGNAVDAAVAVGFALAVTLPRAGNLGGGGFMLIHIASENITLALDYREKAPLLAKKNMYLDKNGNVDTHLSRNHLLSTGVPGTVFGLLEAWERFGSLPLKSLIDPAYMLAQEGFIVSEDLYESLNSAKSRLSDESLSVFFKDGIPYKIGEKLTQSSLAWSLSEISKDGKKAFYSGEIGKKISDFMKKEGGIIRLEDLENYSAVWREPVFGSYKDYSIASMPPPSSGGIHLIQMLHILENFPLTQMGHNSASYIHHLTHAMKHAYADRAKFLGDPDFEEIPESTLLSKKYTRKISQKIKRNKNQKSSRISPGYLFPEEHPETTHYSIVDKWGNAVSNTYTLNFSYGNGIMVPGTGILLNNEMDDFSAKPGSANAYGLIGGEKNKIEPGKRMLSSMTPTFLFKEDRLFLVTGTPGGSRIITMVLQQILNVIEFEMNIAEATAAPRIHHQWYPDILFYETGINKDTLTILQSFGHETKKTRAAGSMQSVLIHNQRLHGASDTRKPGSLSIGY
jgi:gamma-glutamyltranspeptidase/glutathione hydrolase